MKLFYEDYPMKPNEFSWFDEHEGYHERYIKTATECYLVCHRLWNASTRIYELIDDPAVNAQQLIEEATVFVDGIIGKLEKLRSDVVAANRVQATATLSPAYWHRRFIPAGVDPSRGFDLDDPLWARTE